MGVVRHPRSEEGAILPLGAVMFSVIAIMAGVVLAGGTLYSAGEEGRRAADTAALAGAAALPTLNLDQGANPLNLPGPQQLDTPLGTLTYSGSLPGLAQDFRSGTCQVAFAQFGPGGSPTSPESPVTAHWSAGLPAPDCTVSVGLGNAFLDAVAGCLANSGAFTGCATSLQQSLWSKLQPPAPGDQVAQAVAGTVSAAGDQAQVVTSTLMAQLTTLNTQLGGALQPLLDALNGTHGIDVNPDAIAPAILTPQVTVDVRQQVAVPLASLLKAGPVTLHSHAVARRVFKSAVLAPTITLPGPDGTFTFATGPVLTGAEGAAFGALRTVDANVTPAADAAVDAAACPSIGGTCPQASSLTGPTISDLQDLLAPTTGPAPDPATVVSNAVATGEVVMVAAPAELVDPHQFLSQTVWQLPGVSTVVPQLMAVPALDFVPAVLSAGPLGSVVATPVDTVAAAAATRGLYRARLVG